MNKTRAPIFSVLLFVLTACQCATVTAPIRRTDRDIYKMGLNALVTIIVVHGEGTVALGSGVALKRDIILTAAHLFPNQEPKTILVQPSLDLPYKTKVMTAKGIVLAIDVDADLCLLKLSAPLPREPIALGDGANITDPVYYFGNADEAPTTFGNGVITRINYPGSRQRFLQFQGFVWPGMSGGPVLNEQGHLLGVISAVNVVDDPHDEERKVVVPNIGYMIGPAAINKFLRGRL